MIGVKNNLKLPSNNESNTNKTLCLHLKILKCDDFNFELQISHGFYFDIPFSALNKAFVMLENNSTTENMSNIHSHNYYVPQRLGVSS